MQSVCFSFCFGLFCVCGFSARLFFGYMEQVSAYSPASSRFHVPLMDASLWYNDLLRLAVCRFPLVMTFHWKLINKKTFRFCLFLLFFIAAQASFRKWRSFISLWRHFSKSHTWLSSSLSARKCFFCAHTNKDGIASVPETWRGMFLWMVRRPEV